MKTYTKIEIKNIILDIIDKHPKAYGHIMHSKQYKWLIVEINALTPEVI